MRAAPETPPVTLAMVFGVLLSIARVLERLAQAVERLAEKEAGRG